MEKKSVNIFAYKDYKAFVSAYISTLPNQGYGQYKKLSEKLRVSSVGTSLIFKGERHLSEDKALEAAEFLGLSASKTDYFLLLVKYNSAGTESLRRYYREKILQAQDLQKNLSQHIRPSITLSEEQKARYYSDTLYASIRVCLALPDCNTVETISLKLKKSRAKISAALDFLSECGIVQENSGCYEANAVDFHLDADSPYIFQRQVQWRLQAMRKMEERGSQKGDGFYFTAPMSISKKLAESFHAQLLELIINLKKDIAEEQPEELYNLNIDWFSF